MTNTEMALHNERHRLCKLVDDIKYEPPVNFLDGQDCYSDGWHEAIVSATEALQNEADR